MPYKYLRKIPVDVTKVYDADAEEPCEFYSPLRDIMPIADAINPADTDTGYPQKQFNALLCSLLFVISTGCEPKQESLKIHVFETSESGKKLAKFSLATNEHYKDADGQPVRFQLDTDESAKVEKEAFAALEKGEIPAPLYKKTWYQKVYSALFRTELEKEILKLKEKKEFTILDIDKDGRKISLSLKK